MTSLRESPTTHRALSRVRRLHALVPSRRYIAAGAIVGSLGLAAVAGGAGAPAPDQSSLAAQVVAAHADAADRASRGTTREAPAAGAAGTAAAKKPAAPAPAAKAPAKAPAKPAAKPQAKKPAVVKPVAGLDQVQMNNAKVIVDTGKSLGLPKRAWIIAIATAMQESNLYNLASDVIPESLQYAHQGTGADHDSVGLFQQRSTAGWGAVRDLMKPSYAAKAFYLALADVPGWNQMAVTVAAQTVQGSAFPDAYAQHEGRAAVVVNAFG